MNPYKLIFVDDEGHLLRGLERQLRRKNSNWEVTFFDCPKRALRSLEQNQIHVVISDLRMPVIDGADFLSEVRCIAPNTIRFVLSGQAQEEMLIRSLPVTHQYFDKPHPPEELVKKISSAMSIFELNLTPLQLSYIVSNVTFPVGKQSLSLIYDELSSAQPSLLRISSVISADPGLILLCLKLSGTPLVGFQTGIHSIMSICARLGIDVLRTLFLGDSRHLLFSETEFESSQDTFDLVSAVTNQNEEQIQKSVLDSLNSSIPAVEKIMLEHKSIAPLALQALLKLWGIPDQIISSYINQSNTIAPNPSIAEAL